MSEQARALAEIRPSERCTEGRLPYNNLKIGSVDYYAIVGSPRSGSAYRFESWCRRHGALVSMECNRDNSMHAQDLHEHPHNLIIRFEEERWEASLAARI